MKKIQNYKWKTLGVTGLSALSMVVQTAAFSSPTIYQADGSRINQIDNFTTSDLVPDHQDPYKVYVMPPKNGRVVPGSLRGASANLGFCGELKDIQADTREITESMAKLRGKMVEKIKHADQLRRKYVELNLQAEKFNEDDVHLKQIKSIENEIQALEDKTSVLLATAENCKEAESPNPVLCENVDEELKQARARRVVLMRDLSAARSAGVKSIAQYNRLHHQAVAAKEAFEAVYSDVNLTQSKFRDLRATLMAFYREYGSLEGGYSDIHYALDWTENKVKLAEKNPEFRFELMQTKDAQIYAAFSGSGDASSLPAVLDYTVDGRKIDGVVTLPALPENGLATLRLSVVGACAVVHPDYFDVDKSVTGTPYFGISYSFMFPSLYRTEVTFSYRLSRLYEMMRESGTDGGFFTSESWSRFNEKQTNSDAFQVHWQESDPDNILEESKKREIEKEIKNELVERVLKLMGQPQMVGTPLQAGPPPAHGAVVVADGLQSVCGFNVYCLGVSWVLRGLDSIFGSSSTHESVRKQFEGEASEKWTRDTLRYKPGYISYTEKE